MLRLLTALLFAVLLYTCDRAPELPAQEVAFPLPEPLPEPPPPAVPEPDYDTTEWTELIRLDSTFVLDIRYSTDSNFMKQQIYDCGRCFYRPAVARALLAIQEDLQPRGLGLKMFDCYRPGPYQQRLWEVMPDARYVAHPARGSVHSRGAAADLTLVELATGREVDMGTPYDYFGEEAYTTTTDLPNHILDNRQTLQDAMRRRGFSTIRTEWWHFNFGGARLPLSEWTWPCP